MTVEEKRNAIKKHCKKHNIDCTGCLLLAVPRSGLGGCHSRASDKEIERNYDILFGSAPVNTCVSCGAEIPEGRQVCPGCEANDTAEPEESDRPANMQFMSYEEHKENTLGKIRGSVVLDPIKPEYYNDTKITPFDVIDDWKLNFYLGNAVKYIKRAGKKAGNSRLQDLKKIREYIDHEIRAEEGER